MEIYLDYNSTTPLDPLVLKAMQPYLSQHFGNPSSFHRAGQVARHAVEEAREKIADVLQVEPGDIIFTSGGTESDNLAVKGVLEERGEKRRSLVISSIEHQAVLHPALNLEKKGYTIKVVPVNKNGLVDVQKLKEIITEDTALVSLMHVNNETGVIQPIEEAAKLAHDKGALFHTDAVQSFGKLVMRPETVGADLVSLSAHKICGPKGAGALYIRKGVKIKSLTQGGHQEKNIRPGTENVSAIVGFGEAAALAEKLRAEEAVRVKKLRDKLEQGIEKSISGVTVNGDAKKRIYNTLNVSFDALDGETLLMNLDLKNIFVSTGSACTAGSVEPSHVLLAMGISEVLARAAIRFTLGRFTSDKEIDLTLAELPMVVQRLRQASTGKKK